MTNLKMTGVVVATAFLAAACSNDAEDILPVEKTGAVTLTVTPTVQSRVATTDNTATFETGDKIAVSSKGLVEEMTNTVFTVGGDGKSLICDKEFFYDGSDNATFYAYYPASDNGNTETVTFTVADDQNVNKAHSNNDFMTAKGNGNVSTTANLTFTHQLAWAKVTISDVSDASVVIENAKTKVTYTYAQDATDETEKVNESIVTDESESATITMGKHDNEFWALIPGQTFEKGAVLLNITIDENEYTYKPTTDIVFEVGKIKTISLKIANGVMFEEGVSVSAWTDDEEIPGNIFKK